MISFDLKCAGDHVFEAWFRSSADYDAQREAGQIQCPVCGKSEVDKSVMAPAISAKGNRQRPASLSDMTPSPGPSGEAPPTPVQIRAFMHALAEAQAATLKESQWVGDAFAEKARAIYYGEADDALIHGTASAKEARAMLEEGLAVAPLLVPIIPPDKSN